MASSVTIGTDIETGQSIEIGDVERCGGFYILGKGRTGKSTLQIKLALQDIEHGHGLLFIDPAADAINEILVRIPKHRQPDVILLDPTDETHAFSVNVLACANPKSLKERNITFSSAIDIFIKLFPNPQTGALDILLSKYLRNSFYPLIETQGYTLADIPLFLTDKPFRESLLKNVSFNPEVVDFWHYEYAQLPRRDQTKEIESTLNRLNPLLTRDYTKYMVSQAENTVDFARWMDTRKIVLLRMPNWLDDEMKSYIGTILISQLLKAVFLRAENPPQERILFGLYCDEFHLFASPDFAKLFTQTGKFNIMPTVAHVERLGQLKPYDPNLGATLAAPLKVLFSQAVHDSDELAPEMAKPSPKETKFERKPAISQKPIAQLLSVGHDNPQISRFVDKYFKGIEWREASLQEEMEQESLLKMESLDEVALSRVDERKEGFFNSLAARGGGRISFTALERTKLAIEQARHHTANSISLQESTRAVRQTIRYLNYWLVPIMEGRIAKGHEDFSNFVFGWVTDLPYVDPTYKHIPQRYHEALRRYCALVYGDPQTPREVPVDFAQQHGFFTEELNARAQQNAALERQDREAYARQQQREAFFDSERRREDVAWVQKGKQNLRENVRQEILQRKVNSDCLVLGTIGLLKTYMPLLEYPRVQEELALYYTARFAPAWQPQPSAWLASIVKDLEHFRYLNRRLPRHDKRCTACKRVHMGIQPTLLNAFQTFLSRHGEGALVALVLLATSMNPDLWWSSFLLEQDKLEEIRPRTGKYHYEFKKYPGFNMLQVPALANRDPIEVFLSLSKLAEVTAGLNLERDCAKYYWWTVYGENPYEAAKDTSFMSAYSPKAVNKRRLWGKLIFRRTYAPTRAHYCCGNYSTQFE